MLHPGRRLTARLFAAYCAGTVVFALPGYPFACNVRLAFPEPWPGWRAACEDLDQH